MIPADIDGKYIHCVDYATRDDVLAWFAGFGVFPDEVMTSDMANKPGKDGWLIPYYDDEEKEVHACKGNITEFVVGDNVIDALEILSEGISVCLPDLDLLFV